MMWLCLARFRSFWPLQTAFKDVIMQLGYNGLGKPDSFLLTCYLMYWPHTLQASLIEINSEEKTVRGHRYKVRAKEEGEEGEEEGEEEGDQASRQQAGALQKFEGREEGLMLSIGHRREKSHRRNSQQPRSPFLSPSRSPSLDRVN
eukprot:510955-Hanusia_phi.AAC.2